MRWMLAGSALALSCALSGCVSPATSPSSSPMMIDNGAGSQHGNYAARMDGDMRGPNGERCVVFNWDRPLSKDFALRLRSASCESPSHPGRMTCIELERSLVPLAESSVATD